MSWTKLNQTELEWMNSSEKDSRVYVVVEQRHDGDVTLLWCIQPVKTWWWGVISSGFLMYL